MNNQQVTAAMNRVGMLRRSGASWIAVQLAEHELARAEARQSYISAMAEFGHATATATATK
jgi:hypothetical protein